MFIDPVTKTVLLKVRDPFYVRAMIPKSRTVVHPDYNVAVKHTLDSTIMLRNIGIKKVPSPILSQYDWPGKYDPFDHQRTMAEFLTTNKRCFNLSEPGCVDATTEYLTPTGWRRIDQYDGGLVGQYWPDTEEVTFEEPEEYVKLPCTEMIRFQTARGIDQLLSPDHRVLLDNGEVVPARQIEAEHGPQTMAARRHKFRTTFKVSKPGLALPDELLRVQVAANADGWFNRNRVYIRLKKPRKITRMRALLIAAQIMFTEKPCYPDGFVKFSFTPPLQKGFAGWWDASPHQLELVAKEVTYWDGCFRKGGGEQFSSINKEDADFVQYAFTSIGRRASVKNPTGECYVVHASKRNPVMSLGRSRTSRGANVRREPTPDGFKYCFMTKSKFLVLRRNGNIFCTGNTCKTAAALWAADWLMNMKIIDRVLVLSPLSVVERTWMNDIFDTLIHRRGIVVHGSRAERLKALQAPVDFFILNHDGIKISEVHECIKKNPRIKLVIVDEGDEFRNASTQKWKQLEKLLARLDLRVWWMTGTPCPNAPTDAWAQAKIVSPKNVPQFYGSFERQTMIRLTPYKLAPKPEAYNIAFEALQPAIRFKKSECLDLPPVITVSREAQLTDDQIAAFNAMKEDMHADLLAHNNQGIEITAVNAADKLGKLRQILCGSIKAPAEDSSAAMIAAVNKGGVLGSNGYITIPHKPRVAVMLEAIKQAAAKVYIVVPFKGIINVLAQEIEQHYSVGVLNGDVSPKKRDSIIRDFKTTAHPHVLLCHPKVTSHGLNFTEADTLIFYAPIFSNSQCQQVVERFNRPGQTRSMRIVRIGAHPLEWAIYQSVDAKKAGQDIILDLYKSVATW